jgi:hypothetical protein
MTKTPAKQPNVPLAHVDDAFAERIEATRDAECATDQPADFVASAPAPQSVWQTRADTRAARAAAKANGEIER